MIEGDFLLMDSKMVSVIMCYYNEEKYIREALESVICQTYPNIEIIIIDDGSTDLSSKIVSEYHDPRIRYYKNEKNMYLAYSRNRGLKLAKGDFACFFDADDIMESTKIERQVKYIEEHPEIDLVSGGHDFINYKGVVIKKQVKIKYCDDFHIRASQLLGNYISGPNALFRMSIIRNNDIKNDENLATSQDWHFWYQYLQYARVNHRNEIDFHYRVNHGSKAKTYRRNNRVQDDENYFYILNYGWRINGIKLSEDQVKYLYFTIYRGQKLIQTRNDIIFAAKFYLFVKSKCNEINLEYKKELLATLRRTLLKRTYFYELIRTFIKRKEKISSES